jgi:hypothetical protein
MTASGSNTFLMSCSVIAQGDRCTKVVIEDKPLTRNLDRERRARLFSSMVLDDYIGGCHVWFANSQMMKDANAA